MSTLLKNSTGATKITTTFSLSKLQEIPAWNALEVVRAPHSGGLESAASSTRVGSARTIDRAEPCFITNVSAYTHQQTHLINAIRGSSDKHVDDTAVVVSPYPASNPLFKHLLHFQERFLERQGIVDPMFNLDAACNLVNSEPA